MMTNAPIEELRKAFIKSAEDYWFHIKNGDSKEANKSSRANDKRVDKWDKQSYTSEVLSPLLNHESKAVRFAAAAYLVKQTDNDPAIMVLRSLAKEPEGMIAVSAGAVLRVHKIPSE